MGLPLPPPPPQFTGFSYPLFPLKNYLRWEPVFFFWWWGGGDFVKGIPLENYLGWVPGFFLGGGGFCHRNSFGKFSQRYSFGKLPCGWVPFFFVSFFFLGGGGNVQFKKKQTIQCFVLRCGYFG